MFLITHFAKQNPSTPGLDFVSFDLHSQLEHSASLVIVLFVIAI